MILFYNASSGKGKHAAAVIDGMVGKYGALKNMLDLIVATFDIAANEVPWPCLLTRCLGCAC